jgi:hypothetical protein
MALVIILVLFMEAPVNSRCFFFKVKNDLRCMERIKKLSITDCTKILESGGKKYSDKETEMIRDLVYKLGELDYIIINQIKIDALTDNNQSKAA